MNLFNFFFKTKHRPLTSSGSACLTLLLLLLSVSCFHHHQSSSNYRETPPTHAALLLLVMTQPQQPPPHRFYSGLVWFPHVPFPSFSSCFSSSFSLFQSTQPIRACHLAPLYTHRSQLSPFEARTSFSTLVTAHHFMSTIPIKLREFSH